MNRSRLLLLVFCDRRLLVLALLLLQKNACTRKSHQQKNPVLPYGFGELGETALRPSSVGPGFYVELELMNRVYGMEMGRQQMKGMGSLDPISTMVNQYNPVAMMATATQNVRLATLSGKNEGYMWEAQAINLAKAPITMVGSGLMVAGAALASTGAGAVVGGLMYLGGIAVSALGNSISVNPTTGERMTKMTDQAAISTGVSAITSVFAGAAQAAQGVSSAFNWGNAMAQAGKAAAVSLAQSGMRYDEEGRSQGWSLASKHGDRHGENALIGAAVAGATSVASGYGNHRYGLKDMGANLFGDAISTGTNVLVEYGKQQTWGKDKSGYDALGRPDLGRLGSLIGMALESEVKGWGAELKEKAERAQLNEALSLAQKAQESGNKQQAAQILMGMGYSRERSERILQDMAAQSVGEKSLTTQNMDKNRAGYVGAALAMLYSGVKYGNDTALIYAATAGQVGESASKADVLLATGVDPARVDWNQVNQLADALVKGDVARFDAIKQQQNQQTYQENEARVAADRAAAQKYLDSRPWYELAHAKDFLARLTAKNHGQTLGLVDTIKSVLNPSEQVRNDVGSFYSALLRDMGVSVQSSTLKSAIDGGYMAGMVAPVPDMEASSHSIGAAQEGSYGSAAGYGVLAAAGILLSKVKLAQAGGRLFEKQVVHALRESLEGLAKNNEVVEGLTRAGTLRNTIPDLLPKDLVARLGALLDSDVLAKLANGVTDIKDVKKISMSRQLQAQFGYALTEGKPWNLIVSDKTAKIYQPVIDNVRRSGGVILRYLPDSNTFSIWRPR